jgi:hypothetical protein
MLMQYKQLIHTIAVSEVRIYSFKCKIQENKRTRQLLNFAVLGFPKILLKKIDFLY